MQGSTYFQYLSLRELVERGRYEQASEGLRELRDTGTDTDRKLRALIAARIAVQSAGGRPVERGFLSSMRPIEPFVEAETRFTLGIVLFHERSFREGADEFERARAIYLAQGDRERALLAAFHTYAGRVDASSAKARADSLDGIRALEREAFELRNRKLLGLILREKSEVLQTLGRHAAAFEDAHQAMRLLEIYGSKPDHDLATLQAADCALDLGRKHEARAIEQRVLEPVDLHVEFPRAMVRARIAGEFVHPSYFASVIPVMQLKWQTQFGAHLKDRHREASWNAITGPGLRRSGPVRLHAHLSPSSPPADLDLAVAAPSSR